MTDKTIPVGISNRHIHISQSDLEQLFGRGAQLTRMRDISQIGQFAANEALDVIGPRGALANVRIVGPPRRQTQIEISPSDAHRLGVSPPVRYSGDLGGSAACTLRGPAGEIRLSEGVIIPQRHIHMSPRDAREFGVYDRARVMVAPAPRPASRHDSEPRTIVFENVLIRVDPAFVLDFHLDTDEANAAGLQNGDLVRIIGLSKLHKEGRARRLITENDVRQAILRKQKIAIGPRTMITPAAAELARAHDVFSRS